MQPSFRPLSTPELRVVTCNLNVPVTPWIEGRYASYHKTITITAWCFCFVLNLQLKHRNQPRITTPHLTTMEVNRAEHHLLVRAQACSFPNEVYQLQRDKSISHSSKQLALSPVIGKDGLLRVGGRLSNANISLSQSHPIIQSSKDIIVDHLFNYKHVHLGHCGPSLLLSSTGNRFHIVGAKRLARAVCRRCVTCRRVSAKTQSQMMGQLPAPRVTPNPPFTITGVDYAGPFILKKGHTRKPVLIKSYISIFVCFSSKASHIEIISDLTTEAFLAGLKRFIARRGLPQEIHSDNGSNFLGAKNDLNDLYHFLQSTTTISSVNQYLLSQRVQWQCIPERAPHFGGLWEAAVKAAKYHLRRIMGTQRLTYEEFATVTCQIESCLNSRPLKSITSHAIDGISALTPGHLLIGRPLKAYPETTILQKPSLLKRWTMCQAMVHHFWKRWSTEYLKQLQALPKWRTITPNLQPGDIVVIRDDTPFTCHWPLARIIETFPGQDGLVRVVTLKTATTTLKRPVAKLALIHREENSSHDSPNSKTVVLPGEEQVLGHKVIMLAATRVLSHLSTQPRRGLITKVSHRV